MISIDIKNPSIMEKILIYIFVNKDTLLKDTQLICTLNRVKNDNLEIMLGYGKYKINFDNKLIKIIYKEEGGPKALHHEIFYFKRLIVVGDDNVVKKFINTAIKDNTLISSGDTTDIYVSDSYGEWYLYNKVPLRRLDSIYLKPEIKNKIIDDLENFKKSEDEYNSFGIPYKRTYLLTGAPGVGKTSLVKAVCGKYGYSLSMLSVSKKFDNASLIHCLKELGENTILLLEDIDSLFNKRSATEDNPQLTFSNLINILDGVLYKHGVIIFMTTNHPEKLDEALLRMGRIDLIIQIDFPTKDNIKSIYVDMLKTQDNFSVFYDNVKNKKIPMCAIVNFLFRYKSDWLENIDELINTNNFIKKTLNITDIAETLYS